MSSKSDSSSDDSLVRLFELPLDSLAPPEHCLIEKLSLVRPWHDDHSSVFHEMDIGMKIFSGLKASLKFYFGAIQLVSIPRNLLNYAFQLENGNFRFKSLILVVLRKFCISKGIPDVKIFKPFLDYMKSLPGDTHPR